MADPHKELEELQERAAALASEIDEIRSADEPTDEQVERLDAALAEVDELAEQSRAAQEAVEAFEKREKDLEELRDFASRPQNREAGATFHTTRSVEDPYEIRAGASAQELREQVKRVVGENPNMDPTHKENLFKTRSDVSAAEGANIDAKRAFDEHILKTGSDAYISGFSKKMRGLDYEITPEEAEALRSVNIGSSAAGAVLTPHILDPTVLLRDTGTVNPFRSISTVKTIVGGNVFDGVSSAGITAGYLAEQAAFSDNAPTFSAPSITCYKAGAFAPVSFEAFEDISNLQSTIVEMIAAEKDRFEEAEFAIGTGSSAMTGIVTALAAATTVNVANISNHATNSVFTVTDLYSAYELLPPRYRRNASWVMNLAYLDRIRRFGSDFHTYTVDLTSGPPDRVLSRPAYETYSMTQGLNTLTNNAIVYGDFSRYYIVDRLGTQLEFIPQLFTNAGGLVSMPLGARGWLAHWRGGANAITTNSFVLSRNLGIT